MIRSPVPHGKVMHLCMAREKGAGSETALGLILLFEFVFGSRAWQYRLESCFL